MFRKKCVNYAKRQQGFLIPVALVIVVGLSALALAISNLSSQSGSSSFREGITMQAFYAAESGVQYGMHRLLFPAATRAAANTACTALNGDSINFTATGLNNCSADFTCTATTNADDTISFYTVQSNAQCGSGELMAQRSIQATAYIE